MSDQRVDGVGEAPPADAEEWVAMCSECPAVFTADEIGAEDEEAWGHPCHARRFKMPTRCESYREVWVKTADHVDDGQRCSTNHDHSGLRLAAILAPADPAPKATPSETPPAGRTP